MTYQPYFDELYPRTEEEYEHLMEVNGYNDNHQSHAQTARMMIIVSQWLSRHVTLSDLVDTIFNKLHNTNRIWNTAEVDAQQEEDIKRAARNPDANPEDVICMFRPDQLATYGL